MGSTGIVSEQPDLIPRENVWELPQDYEPVVPAGFDVRQIVLCRGSLDTPQRERFVRRICSVFPTAKVSEELNTVHNRVELHEPEPAHRVAMGKQTLVFGELSPKHAVWDGVQDGSQFYFVHSYAPTPSDPDVALGVTDYHGEFASTIGRDNVVACQFHPERSGRVGLKLLDNFLAWNP